MGKTKDEVSELGKMNAGLVDKTCSAIDEGVTLLVPLLDKISREMFLSSKKLPKGTTDLKAALVALASVTSAFLGRLQKVIKEQNFGDVVETYLSFLMPMLAKIAPHVVDTGEDMNQALEEFLTKELLMLEGPMGPWKN